MAGVGHEAALAIERRADRAHHRPGGEQPGAEGSGEQGGPQAERLDPQQGGGGLAHLVRRRADHRDDRPAPGPGRDRDEPERLVDAAVAGAVGHERSPACRVELGRGEEGHARPRAGGDDGPVGADDLGDVLVRLRAGGAGQPSGPPPSAAATSGAATDRSPWSCERWRSDAKRRWITVPAAASTTASRAVNARVTRRRRLTARADSRRRAPSRSCSSRRGVDLVSQVAHVYVDHVGAVLEVVIPALLEQLERETASRVPHERLEQREFLRRQVDRGVTTPDLVGAGVERGGFLPRARRRPDGPPTARGRAGARGARRTRTA